MRCDSVPSPLANEPTKLGKPCCAGASGAAMPSGWSMRNARSASSSVMASTIRRSNSFGVTAPLCAVKRLRVPSERLRDRVPHCSRLPIRKRPLLEAVPVVSLPWRMAGCVLSGRIPVSGWLTR